MTYPFYLPFLWIMQHLGPNSNYCSTVRQHSMSDFSRVSSRTGTDRFNVRWHSACGGPTKSHITSWCAGGGREDPYSISRINAR